MFQWAWISASSSHTGLSWRWMNSADWSEKCGELASRGALPNWWMLRPDIALFIPMHQFHEGIAGVVLDAPIALDIAVSGMQQVRAASQR